MNSKIIYLIIFLSLSTQLYSAAQKSRTEKLKASYSNAKKKHLQLCDAKVRTEPTDELTATWNAVKKIHALARDLSEAEKKRSDGDKLLTVAQWPTIVPGSWKTKKGLVLECTSYPRALYTPWGKIKIYEHSQESCAAAARVFEVFRNKMRLAFNANSGEKTYSCQPNFFRERRFNFITEAQLAQYRGTDTFIFADLICYASSYVVSAIDGEALPHPEFAQEPISTDEYEFNIYALAKLPPIIPLPSAQKYFNFSTKPSSIQAWHKCKTNADKIFVFEKILEVIEHEKNKKVAKLQAAILKSLLQHQTFLDYIQEELLERIDELIK